MLRNLPSPVARLLALLVFPLGRRERGPHDALGAQAAHALLEDDRARDALTAGIFLPRADELGLGRLDTARRIVRPRADEHDDAAHRAAEHARRGDPGRFIRPRGYAELRR